VTSRSTGGSTLLLLALVTEARSCFGDETGYRSPKDDNCPIQTTFPFLMLNWHTRRKLTRWPFTRQWTHPPRFRRMSAFGQKQTMRRKQWCLLYTR